MYNLTVVLVIYSGILTMCMMSAAVGIIIIGVKRTRNIKKNVSYIDNVVMLLSDKITNVNDSYNQELRKLKSNISLMDDIIRDVVGNKKLTDDEIRLFNCVNPCEDTIKQENYQDRILPEDKLYTLLRGGSL